MARPSTLPERTTDPVEAVLRPPATWSIAVRSFLFQALFMATLAGLLFLTPLLLLPRGFCYRIIRSYLFFTLWHLKVITGLSYEVRGLENLPREACLVACKHQSAFETLLLEAMLNDPAIILKKELFHLPVAGWMMKRLGHIGIDRSGGASSLVGMLKVARKRLSEGRSILIFPEGARRAPLAPPDYKGGVTALYRALKVPCVPVALNSGVFWPRQSFLRYPGRIVIEILPPIMPPEAGDKAHDFLARLTDSIETASARLVREAMPPIR